jgi:uncharacterized membrane protein
MPLSWRVYGLGVIAIAMFCLAWGTFDPGQPVNNVFPNRTVLAYLAGTLMFVAGVAIEWRRTVKWGATALFIYYTLIVLIVMHGHVILGHYKEFMAYSNAAAQLAIAAGALIVYAASGKIDGALAAKLTRLAQLAFGICAVLFGGAHFFYMELTAPLVPKWLPLSQEFWGYATGVGHIAAGVAILTGLRARLAATLLTWMFASFLLFVFGPMLAANPTNHFSWTESAATFALIGVAWVVADSLEPRS